MNTKELLAAIVGGVVAFLLGWLLFGILLADFMDKNMIHYEGLMKGEGEMNLALMFVSNLCVAFLLAWLGNRTGVDTPVAGLKLAAVVGFFFYLSVDLSFMSMMNLFTSPVGLVVDVVSNTVWASGIGAAVGFMLGRGKQSAS